MILLFGSSVKSWQALPHAPGGKYSIFSDVSCAIHPACPEPAAAYPELAEGSERLGESHIQVEVHRQHSMPAMWPLACCLVDFYQSVDDDFICEHRFNDVVPKLISKICVIVFQAHWDK